MALFVPLGATCRPRKSRLRGPIGKQRAGQKLRKSQGVLVWGEEPLSDQNFEEGLDSICVRNYSVSHILSPDGNKENREDGRRAQGGRDIGGGDKEEPEHGKLR